MWQPAQNSTALGNKVAKPSHKAYDLPVYTLAPLLPSNNLQQKQPTRYLLSVAVGRNHTIVLTPHQTALPGQIHAAKPPIIHSPAPCVLRMLCVRAITLDCTCISIAFRCWILSLSCTGPNPAAVPVLQLLLVRPAVPPKLG